jgi:flagellar biogenesis protein FliO
MRYIIFLVTLLSTIGLSAGQSDSVFTAIDSVQQVQMPSMKMFALKTVLALVVIAVLLYAFVFLLKKLSGYGTLGKIGNESGLIDMLPLANKQGIYVVNILDVIYVVGFSQENLVLLDKITDEETVKLLKMKKQDNKISLNFDQIFKGKQNEQKPN